MIFFHPPRALSSHMDLISLSPYSQFPLSSFYIFSPFALLLFLKQSWFKKRWLLIGKAKGVSLECTVIRIERYAKQKKVH